MDLIVPSVSLPGIERYLEKNLESRNELFKKAEKIAKDLEAPVVGPLVGNFLHTMCKLTSAKKVLELGSSIGYSTLWFADAIGEGGEVVFTDFDPENAKVACNLAKDANFLDRIIFHVGDAFEYLNATNDEYYDIIFIDLDKSFYVDALEKALPKLKVGGLIIADNTLWGGRVRWDLDDENTVAIKKYNEIVSSHHLLDTSIIPLRDGITISIKKSDK